MGLSRWLFLFQERDILFAGSLEDHMGLKLVRNHDKGEVHLMLLKLFHPFTAIYFTTNLRTIRLNESRTIPF
jgi:hypothetical protein